MPASLVAWSLGGSAVLGLWVGFAALTILGGLTSTIAVLGWFACLARGRMPRGMRDAAAYGCGYAAQVTAYALMVTARYPDSSPDRLAPTAELPPHPIAVDVRDDLGRPRLLVLFRLPLVVPHLLWLTLWSVLVTAAVLVGWLAALALGRLPRSSTASSRRTSGRRRTSSPSSTWWGVRFPASSAGRAATPSTSTIAPPARQRRVGVLFRLVLAVPALVLSCAYGGCSSSSPSSRGSWRSSRVAIPEGLRDLGVSSLRYQMQITAYLLLLTSRYPDSSPVLVGRPEPPPGPEAVA